MIIEKSQKVGRWTHLLRQVSQCQEVLLQKAVSKVTVFAKTGCGWRAVKPTGLDGGSASLL
jgi:hypothetical protein